MRVLALLLVLLLAAAPRGAAQSGAPPTLAGVEALLEAHRYAEARGMLRAWWQRAGSAATGEERARGLFLRAALAPEPAEAEIDLVRVVVEHPQTRVADRALLRLAQSRLAHGDSAAARAHLERLVRDYPESAERAAALALLGRRAEPPRASVPAPAPRRSAPAPAPRAAQRIPPPDAEIPPHGAEFAAQIGRFRGASEAEPLRDRLRAAGFDAYLARIGASNETVVRVGSFRELAAAEALVRRLREAGHDARAVAIGAS